jgi:iron(III) transport system substrate-binding protein
MKKKLLGILFFMSFGCLATQNEINLITDRSDFHINTMVDDFQKKHNIKVNVDFVKKGIIEKSKSGTYDVMISKDSSEVVATSDLGMLKPISEKTLKNIPKEFKDNKNRSWFLMSYRIRAIHVRKDVTDIPLTYTDLAKPQYKNRICIRSLTDNYNLELFGTMLSDMGEEKFTEWFKNFKLNLSRDPVGNDRNQVQAVYNKICDIAIVNTYYRGLMLEDPEQKSWAESTVMYIPDQGKKDNGAIALFAGVGIMSNNPNNEKLLDYLISDNVQKELSLYNYENPINSKNTSETVKTYGIAQGLNYKSIKLHKNIQNELVDYKKKVYFIIKSN